MFFAISGLLITSRLLADETKTGSLRLKSFYIRRGFRILPPSLIYLAVVGVLSGLGIISVPFDYWRAALLFYLNFTVGSSQLAPDVGHFWTLAVEEHFYSVWPAFLQFEKKQCRLVVAVSICLFLAGWRCLNIKFASHMAIVGMGYYQHQGRTDFTVDRILWGAIVALAYSQYSGQDWVRRLLTPPVAVAMSIAVVGSFVVEPGWKTEQGLLFVRTIFIPIVLLITILNCRGVVALVLENPLLKWVGRLSYSLYLWNQLFLVWGMPDPSRVPWPHRWPTNMACTFGCAIVSYYLIERPLIKIGHQVVQRLYREVASGTLA